MYAIRTVALRGRVVSAGAKFFWGMTWAEPLPPPLTLPPAAPLTPKGTATTGTSYYLSTIVGGEQQGKDIDTCFAWD